jgi:periplasmic divalent cation tolerance protein
MYMFIYVTAEGMESAERIARHLLEKKLVACVNMFEIKSMYWWEGKIEESPEIGMILKTRAEKFKELREEIKKIHTYQVPCIVGFTVEDGLKEYLQWIDSCVKG